MQRNIKDTGSDLPSTGSNLPGKDTTSNDQFDPNSIKESSVISGDLNLANPELKPLTDNEVGNEVLNFIMLGDSLSLSSYTTQNINCALFTAAGYKPDGEEEIERMSEFFAQLSLRQDLDFKARNDVNNNWTPLHYAAGFGNVIAVKFIINKARDIDMDVSQIINSTNYLDPLPLGIAQKNDTPLILAARSGFMEIIEILIKEGVNVDHKDIDNRSYLENLPDGITEDQKNKLIQSQPRRYSLSGPISELNLIGEEVENTESLRRMRSIPHKSEPINCINFNNSNNSIAMPFQQEDQLTQDNQSLFRVSSRMFSSGSLNYESSPSLRTSSGSYGSPNLKTSGIFGSSPNKVLGGLGVLLGKRSSSDNITLKKGNKEIEEEYDENESRGEQLKKKLKSSSDSLSLKSSSTDLLGDLSTYDDIFQLSKEESDIKLDASSNFFTQPNSLVKDSTNEKRGVSGLKPNSSHSEIDS